MEPDGSSGTGLLPTFPKGLILTFDCSAQPLVAERRMDGQKFGVGSQLDGTTSFEVYNPSALFGLLGLVIAIANQTPDHMIKRIDIVVVED